MIAGILSGLGAAFCQSLSYLCTRHYVQRRLTAGNTGGSRQLLVLGHVWMGLFSAILLWAAWPKNGLPVMQMLDPLLMMTLFYIGGQTTTTFALRYAEPSRVSPLMGFKIVVLAGIASVVVQPRITGAPLPPGLTPLHWVAAALAVVAAVALNYTGGALRRRAALSILAACISYSIADWNITRTNLAIFRLAPGTTALQASLLSAGLCYGLAGIVGAVLLPWWGSKKPKDWSDAIPFSITWFIAMMFLYTCFSEVGPLLGNILQSTRGLMSILLGSLLVFLGHLHIEPISARHVLIRRLLAAVLMVAAVSLYVIREPATLRMWLWGKPAARTTPWLMNSNPPIAGTRCSTRAMCANSA
jgi:hypothetical protein